MSCRSPSTVRTDVAAYRALETTVGLPHHLPINLDEYAARYQLTSPGQMVAWLSALEAEKVDGDLAYWNINGTLGDSVAQQNIPNAQWWLYNWYSSMSGHTVRGDHAGRQHRRHAAGPGHAGPGETAGPDHHGRRPGRAGGRHGQGHRPGHLRPHRARHDLPGPVERDDRRGGRADPDVRRGRAGRLGRLDHAPGDQRRPGRWCGRQRRVVHTPPGRGCRARSATRCRCAATTNTSACRPASCRASPTSPSRPGSIPRPTPPGPGCSTSAPAPTTTCS